MIFRSSVLAGGLLEVALAGTGILQLWPHGVEVITSRDYGKQQEDNANQRNQGLQRGELATLAKAPRLLAPYPKGKHEQQQPATI
jgi:hypothetical protein